MKLKKAIYVVVGCLGVGLGAVGAVVPMLPAFPFLMLAAFCFAKSSQRLHTWFTHTKLYRENLADYVSGDDLAGQKTRDAHSHAAHGLWLHPDAAQIALCSLPHPWFRLGVSHPVFRIWCQDERGRGNDRGLHSFLRTPRYGP